MIWWYLRFRKPPYIHIYIHIYTYIYNFVYVYILYIYILNIYYILYIIYIYIYIYIYFKYFINGGFNGRIPQAMEVVRKSLNFAVTDGEIMAGYLRKMGYQ